MGAHDFKYNKVPLFARKPGNINTSMSAAPKIDLVPALRCKLVILQCICQVSLGLKEVQMGPMTFNISRCIFLLEKQGISILRCLLPRNYLLCQQAVITAM